MNMHSKHQILIIKMKDKIELFQNGLATFRSILWLISVRKVEKRQNQAARLIFDWWIFYSLIDWCAGFVFYWYIVRDSLWSFLSKKSSKKFQILWDFTGNLLKILENTYLNCFIHIYPNRIPSLKLFWIDYACF